METTRKRWSGGALLALTVAGGLLLGGCSGTGGQSEASYDHGKARGPGAAAPGRAAPQEETDEESREAAPSPDLVSTFALDVDTASYGYARRTLAEGRLPDPSTVRPEEFVNSFRQDYERPDGNGFSVTVDGARTGEKDWSLMRVGLATRPADPAGKRPPAALTFVVDISGSMSEPGRLDLAKRSLDVLTDRLRGDDSVAIVTFSDEAETVLRMTRLGGNRAAVHDAIDTLEPTDSTNLGAGVETGYETAVDGLREGAVNRVVLVSDALANTGDTDAGSILERVAAERREHGITLFGVGVGSDYGDALMERLADRGDGHTEYVSDEEDAAEVFCDRLPQNLELTARDAKAQVVFDPENVREFRLVGYDNRAVADDDFRDDRVDGGEVGPGHTVTALYAVRTAPGAGGHLATATVRWLDPRTRAPHEESGAVEASGLHGSLSEAPARFQVTALAAYFADALRGSGGEESAAGREDRAGDDVGPRGRYGPHGRLPGAPGLAELAERAGSLARRTEDDAVRDLAEAVRQADRYGA